jgi:hypothetical protein
MDSFEFTETQEWMLSKYRRPRIDCSECRIICDDNKCPCELCLVKSMCKKMCWDAYIYFLHQISIGKKRD